MMLHVADLRSEVQRLQNPARGKTTDPGPLPEVRLELRFRGVSECLLNDFLAKLLLFGTNSIEVSLPSA